MAPIFHNDIVGYSALLYVISKLGTHFLVQRWYYCHTKTSKWMTSDTAQEVYKTIDEARENVPIGFVPYPVFRNDDDRIYEKWVATNA